jgi:hypothetical protein
VTGVLSPAVVLYGGLAGGCLLMHLVGGHGPRRPRRRVATSNRSGHGGRAAEPVPRRPAGIPPSGRTSHVTPRRLDHGGFDRRHRRQWPPQVPRASTGRPNTGR